MSHAAEYLAETRQITERIDYEMLERIAQGLVDLRSYLSSQTLSNRQLL